MAMTTDEQRPTERRERLAAVLRVEVQLWLAVLFMAMAFGAGVIVHAMAAPQPSSPAIVGSVDGAGVSGGPEIFAPPLSDEQVNAGLPAGHPDIGGGSAPEQPDADGRTDGGKATQDDTVGNGSSP